MKKRTGKPANVFTLLGTIFACIGTLFFVIGLVMGIFSFVSPSDTFEGFEGFPVFVAVYGLVGIVFAIVGFTFLAVSRKSQKKQEELIRSGEQLCAEVTGGSLDFAVRVNRQHPYRLECCYKDPFTGDAYLFRSGYIWQDPSFYLGREVTVYADRNDRSRYYVDTDSLTETSINVDDYTNVHDYR